MPDSNSSHIWTILDRALKLPAAERDDFLIRECGGNTDLLTEARALLTLVEQNRDLFDASTSEATQAVTSGLPGEQSHAGDPHDLRTLIPGFGMDLSTDEFTFEAGRCAERKNDIEYWIGPYQLLKLLGKGGFGAVFLAQRREPIQFYVAIKVIQAGGSSPQILARFEQEREILASLDHPGIARVIDAGNSPLGVPFVAMEYVPGKILTRYCNDHQLTLEARLDLFREVCDAVQHAHQRGIIHRDLKPGNILVRDASGTPPQAGTTAASGEAATTLTPASAPPRKPIVKIIDFGIAKATQPLRSSLSVRTEGNISPMTLQYASPEQAGAGGISPRDIDVRSDVFSLGVILYELLTGTRPIDEHELQMAAQFEQLRMIREAERPRASTKLSELDRLTPTEMEEVRSIASETQRSIEQVQAEYLAEKRGEAQRIARERQIGVDKLRQRLRGDLDSILRKALELDRERRYESPLSMANDIGSYLRGEAVPAHDAGAWYRFSKFVLKNRAAVAAVGAVMLAIVVGGAVAGWKWRDELAARKREELAKQEAIAQRDAVTKLAEFVSIDLLEEPFDTDGAFLRVPVEVVDRARDSLQTRFADWPALDALLSAALGRAYMAGGHAASAEALLKRARSRVESGAAVAPHVVDKIGSDLARASFRLHADNTAIDIIEPLVLQREAELGAEANTSKSFADLLYVLGGAYKRGKRWEAAKDAYERSMRIFTAAGGPKERLYSLRTNLLLVRLEQTRAAARVAKQNADPHAESVAKRGFEELLDAFRTVAREASTDLGPQHIEAVAPLTEAAAIAGRLGMLDAADRDFSDALAALRGRAHTRSWRLSETLARYGNILLANKQYPQAAALLTEALDGYLDPSIKGPSHLDSLTVSRWASQALEANGEFARAATILEQHYELASAEVSPANVAHDIACELSELFKRAGDQVNAAKWARSCKP